MLVAAALLEELHEGVAHTGSRPLNSGRFSSSGHLRGAMRTRCLRRLWNGRKHTSWDARARQKSRGWSERAAEWCRTLANKLKRVASAAQDQSHTTMWSAQNKPSIPSQFFLGSFHEAKFLHILSMIFS